MRVFDVARGMPMQGVLCATPCARRQYFEIPETARRLFVRRLTVNEFLDIRRDQMRLVRLVDDDRTESTRHNAARQAFAKIVRLFLVVGLMAHVMSPLTAN